jgi:hypothetical protein
VGVVQLIPEKNDLVLILPVAIGGVMLLLSFVAYKPGPTRDMALVG